MLAEQLFPLGDDTRRRRVRADSSASRQNYTGVKPT